MSPRHLGYPEIRIPNGRDIQPIWDVRDIWDVPETFRWQVIWAGVYNAAAPRFPNVAVSCFVVGIDRKRDLKFGGPGEPVEC